MGVSCLKLEGRMKRPEYVAVITRIYARLLEEGPQAYRRRVRGTGAGFLPPGFTDAYWRGRHGEAMFGTRPENTPEPKELLTRPGGPMKRTICGRFGWTSPAVWPLVNPAP